MLDLGFEFTYLIVESSFRVSFEKMSADISVTCAWMFFEGEISTELCLLAAGPSITMFYSPRVLAVWYSSLMSWYWTRPPIYSLSLSPLSKWRLARFKFRTGTFLSTKVGQRDSFEVSVFCLTIVYLEFNYFSELSWLIKI